MMDQDLSQFDDFDTTDEEYDAIASGCLQPSPVASKKGDTYRWPEQMVVREIVAEDWDGGANAEDGDVTLRYDLTFAIAPTSTDGNGGPSPNVGERFITRLFFNLSAAKEGRDSGHTGMTKRNMARVHELADALGIENDYSGNAAKFFGLHGADLVGQIVTVNIRQSPQDKGSKRREDNLAYISEAEA